jgi:phosphoesterase RecJ-like protein
MEEIIDLIKDHERFAISTHISPEADAIGSALALRLILRRLGKEALVVIQDPVPQNLRFLKGTEGVKTPRDFGKFDPELWFVVDCAGLDRVGDRVVRLIEGSGKPIINIDHHIDNPGFGDYNYVRPIAAATQLVLELAQALGVLEPEIATSLYAGIVADTDSFRNANTDAPALRDAAALVEEGARAREVTINLYERRRPGELRLLGYGLLNAHLEGSIIWCGLPLKTFAELGASSWETEHLVEDLRSLEGIEVAALFKELEGGRVKVSLRAKGDLKVNEVAQRFGGGGHEQAAGCIVEGALAAVEQLVLGELRRRLDAGQFG